MSPSSPNRHYLSNEYPTAPASFEEVSQGIHARSVVAISGPLSTAKAGHLAVSHGHPPRPELARPGALAANFQAGIVITRGDGSAFKSVIMIAAAYDGTPGSRQSGVDDPYIQTHLHRPSSRLVLALDDSPTVLHTEEVTGSNPVSPTLRKAHD